MMHVRIDSLRGILFESDAESLTVGTKSGEITVLPNHRSLITSLRPGAAKVIDANGDEKYFEVKSGFLEVKNIKSGTFLTLLVD
ncbi:F0F1 ATP synthase subunit epsilon [Patescibacteria group bacterium]|nr:F0F1 ATP synthase subunit epsilon [Patescibacteria group bacterium]MCL5114748.1 F0F1 ATP synthase subunit epsilon [Patescibacteria group bacterium]